MLDLQSPRDRVLRVLTQGHAIPKCFFCVHWISERVRVQVVCLDQVPVGVARPRSAKPRALHQGLCLLSTSTSIHWRYEPKVESQLVSKC